MFDDWPVWGYWLMGIVGAYCLWVLWLMRPWGPAARQCQEMARHKPESEIVKVVDQHEQWVVDKRFLDELKRM